MLHLRACGCAPRTVRGQTMQVSGLAGPSGLQQMQQRLFAKADTDGNGSLALDEFEAFGSKATSGRSRPPGAPDAKEVFGQLDTDKDGQLTQSEFSVARPP